jgi:hypothetical protein
MVCKNCGRKGLFVWCSDNSGQQDMHGSDLKRLRSPDALRCLKSDPRVRSAVPAVRRISRGEGLLRCCLNPEFPSQKSCHQTQARAGKITQGVSVEKQQEWVNRASSTKLLGLFGIDPVPTFFAVV